MGLLTFSWNVAKTSKPRTMGNKQIINHIDGKTSSKTITPNSLDEKTKYLKKDYVKKSFLEIIVLDQEDSNRKSLKV